MKFQPVILLLFLSSFSISASNIYVAPNGDDTNNGSINKPLETIKKAQDIAKQGDTVFIRGGRYIMRENQIAKYYRIWAYVTELHKNGINYYAYKDEQPIFDFSNIKVPKKRIIAFYIKGENIHIKGIDITGVQATIKVGNSQSECIKIEGGNNITIETVNMYDNMAIGVYITKGKDNLILNCDAYRNYDHLNRNGYGGNADGFGVHVKNGDTGNVLRGCRAWLNSDDGFDTISSGEPVLIDNCWAFYNGFSSDDGTLENVTSRGDGNGFKIGGYGKDRSDFNEIMFKYAPIPRNTIKFSIAAGNKQSGFYANHHLEGNNWINNSAYANKRNYNMLNCKALNPQEYGVDIPGKDHHLVNNLGLSADTEELSNIDKDNCILRNNYFDLSVTVDANDFISLNVNELILPRKKDGSLPDINFLKLKSSSDLIDVGYDIGFPFNGKAPDLGAFESKN
ncbi:DUF4990 domain-containing protein [Winogradskyella echinorum]|uniref:DUF4990 domain-containing protein n=1 Tax=Winogradskyella echinorum TaxID=538189 RepID=A0ABR6Y1B6_9FLAO|nr:DUF4990 domain-containing protein [Winogradskyella echinorum]MBC3846549.1 DUF4990 domain-containing protein [Winogradskyella echinorum]MBC5750897.1 DUF4990 domain-containing protein [Winogradskyella echinorum]